MRLETVAAAAIDVLLRICAVRVAVVLFDAPDKFQKEATGRAAGVDIGRAQPIGGQAADVAGPLKDDGAPPALATLMPVMMPAGVPPTMTASNSNDGGDVI